MTPAQLLDALDSAGVAYQVRDGQLVWRCGSGLPEETIAALKADRQGLAAEAMGHYTERGIEPWRCHACAGLVRAGRGRIVHPPDWPRAKRKGAPVMHTWCYAAQPWWQADVDDPLAAYADVIVAARAGLLPAAGSVPLDKTVTIYNPRDSVIANTEHIEGGDCWWRTSLQGMDALARLEAVAAWWRRQEERRAA